MTRARGFDLDALVKQAKSFPGLEGLDLAKDVSCRQTFTWNETPWRWNQGYGHQTNPSFRAVVVDYGVKRNILRLLAGSGADIVVLPANSTAEDVMRHRPHGVMLSNGPGDPAATGEYAIPMIRGLIDKGLPVFGICLGHQMLGLALGGKTHKMSQGHHGANHPVKDLETGKVEIVSMNHGFTVDRDKPAQGRQGDACVAVRRHQLRPPRRGRARSSRCSIIPRRRPVRWIRIICSSGSRRRRRRAHKACHSRPNDAPAS